MTKEKKITKAQQKLLDEQEQALNVVEYLDNYLSYIEISNIEELKELLENIGHEFAVDTETSGLDARKGQIELYGISISNKEGTSFWIPKPTKAMLKLMNQYFKRSHIIFFNAVYDIAVLELFGIKIKDFSDTMIGAHLAFPNDPVKGLKQIALHYLTGVGEILELPKLLGKKKKNIEPKDFLLLDDSVQRVYGSQDADLTWRLWEMPEINDVQYDQKFTWKLEHDQVRPQIHMKDSGIKIDIDLLNDQDEVLKKAYDSIQKQIDNYASELYNRPTKILLTSWMQKSNFIYGPFNKKTGKHNKRLALKDDKGKPIEPLFKNTTGHGSTQKKYMEQYRQTCEPIELILRASSFASLRSNFTSKIPELINEDGKLRPSLWSTGTSTGRYTCTEPNGQNIATCAADWNPINIRQAFIADDNWIFINPDYSQIELRIAASLSKETTWINAFKNGQSPHEATAIEMFGIKYQQYQYKRSKNANFGVLFGQTPYTFQMMYGLTERETEKFFRDWNNTVPRLLAWIKQQNKIHRSLGYATSMFGRVRPLGDSPADSIRSSDDGIAKSWERRGISQNIQGTAADIMKIAIRNAYEEILKADFPIQLLLTIHDELLFHTPKKYKKKAIELIKKSMIFPVKNLIVPLEIDIGIGTTWGTCASMRNSE